MAWSDGWSPRGGGGGRGRWDGIDRGWCRRRGRRGGGFGCDGSTATATATAASASAGGIIGIVRCYFTQRRWEHRIRCCRIGCRGMHSLGAKGHDFLAFERALAWHARARVATFGKDICGIHVTYDVRYRDGILCKCHRGCSCCRFRRVGEPASRISAFAFLRLALVPALHLLRHERRGFNLELLERISTTASSRIPTAARATSPSTASSASALPRAILHGIPRGGALCPANRVVVSRILIVFIVLRGVRRAIFAKNLTLPTDIFPSRILHDDERRIVVVVVNRRPHVMAVVAQNVVRMSFVFVVKYDGGG
mmetsp:Transcript_2297/g.7623  ORF Transcript_2297/g.7623 Transcript_2297/m.7623 type:complete len:311 (+) Transcript_2297:33-965(+)